MRFPRLHLSLAALLVLAAILGPGIGLASRWRMERERTALIRLATDGIKRIDAGEPDVAEEELKRLLFLVENSPDLTAGERERLAASLSAAITQVGRDAVARRMPCN